MPNKDSKALAAMKDPHHLNGQTNIPVSPLHKLDYVNALILNKAGEALVLEVEKPGNGVYWQLLDQYLQPKEDPFTAVQHQLQQMTGVSGQAVGLPGQPCGGGQPIVWRGLSVLCAAGNSGSGASAPSAGGRGH
jgi:hypothetical protein